MTAPISRTAVDLGRAGRYLGALLLLGVAAIHLWEYIADYYRVIPTIGGLFLANSIVAVVLGLAILAPVERVGRPLLALSALAGVGFAAGTIVGLAISEASTLFGFHEDGYRTTIILSLIFEGAVIVLLGLFLLVEATRLRSSANAPPAAADEGGMPPDAA